MSNEKQPESENVSDLPEQTTEAPDAESVKGGSTGSNAPSATAPREGGITVPRFIDPCW